MYLFVCFFVRSLCLRFASLIA